MVYKEQRTSGTRLLMRQQNFGDAETSECLRRCLLKSPVCVSSAMSLGGIGIMWTDNCKYCHDPSSHKHHTVLTSNLVPQ